MSKPIVLLALLFASVSSWSAAADLPVSWARVRGGDWDVKIPDASGSAAAVGPLLAAQPSVWSRLMTKLAKNGVLDRGEDLVAPNIGFESFRGPRQASHTADFINLWGRLDPAGGFVGEFVTLVSEDWTLSSDGFWHIEQWVFTVSLEGVVTETLHNALVEDPQGSLQDIRSYPPEASASRKKLDSLLSGWLEFKP